MTNAHEIAPTLDLPLRRPRPHPLLSVCARVRGPFLDAQFVKGAESWRSATHAARALQLTSARSRRSLARALERLLKEATQPPTPLRRGGPIPVCRSQVRAAEPEIRALAARLRSSAPVDVRGIARLLEVLRDGSGPVFAPAWPGGLAAALRDVGESLDAPE